MLTTHLKEGDKRSALAETRLWIRIGHVLAALALLVPMVKSIIASVGVESFTFYTTLHMMTYQPVERRLLRGALPA